MNFKRVTKWDHLELAYPRLHDCVRGRGPVATSLRCTARIEPYEDAVRALEARGAHDAGTQGLLRALADDYRARGKHWSIRAPKVPEHPAVAGFFIGVIGLAGPAALLGAMYTDGELFSLTWWQTGLVTLPLVLPAVYLACRSLLARSLSAGLSPALALVERRCSDCGLSTDGAPPGIPVALAGVNVGPRTCRGCERPWPLVPPPVDAVDLTEVYTPGVEEGELVREELNQPLGVSRSD